MKYKYVVESISKNGYFHDLYVDKEVAIEDAAGLLHSRRMTMVRLFQIDAVTEIEITR